MAGDNGTSQHGTAPLHVEGDCERPPQCSGRTGRGDPCRRFAVDGDRCEYHPRRGATGKQAGGEGQPYSDTSRTRAPASLRTHVDIDEDSLRDDPEATILRAMLATWAAFWSGSLSDRDLREARDTLDRLGALAEAAGPPDSRGKP